jgi:D-psicose/D-tagatose/L-ribulose 3-epimerase
MKIAISNIAWQSHEEKAIAYFMQQLGIEGVEIAPTKIWSSPLTASDAEIAEYKQFWLNHQIQIVAMQALLFGKPDLTIFSDAQKRQETIDYLAGIIQLGAKFGAKVLVFGSPKNRHIKDLPAADVAEIAGEFFDRIGTISHQVGVQFCIEPNPTAYDCDFINDSSQGLDLVKSVANPGFGLHLDAAGMTLSQENIDVAIENASSHLCHFHISEPYLEPIGTGGVEHEKFAAALRRSNYRGWTSIEMKAQHPDNNLVVVEKALKMALKVYR